MSKAQQDFKKLQKTLKKLPEKLQNSVVNSGVRAAAAIVRDEAKEKVHKDSMELKKAIKVKKRRTRKGSPVVRYSVYIKKVELPNGAVGKNTKQYGYYQEYGTKNMSAKPFLRPALNAVGQKPVTAAREQIKKKLPAALKKMRGK